MRSAKWGVRSAECEVGSGEWGVGSGEWGVESQKMRTRSQKLKCFSFVEICDMRRIAIIIIGLVLSHCGHQSPTSPEVVAGVYALQAVKVDLGSGRAQVYVNHEAEENPPSGFIELNRDRTYHLFASFGGPDQSVWETGGKYGVNSRFEITFSTPGRNFLGAFSNQRSRISVTELLYGTVVVMVFDRAR